MLNQEKMKIFVYNIHDFDKPLLEVAAKGKDERYYIAQSLNIDIGEISNGSKEKHNHFKSKKCKSKLMRTNTKRYSCLYQVLG